MKFSVHDFHVRHKRRTSACYLSYCKMGN